MRVVDVRVDQLADLDRTLVSGSEDRDHHRRGAVEAGKLFGLGKSVDDGRDVAETQPAAVGACPDDQVFELLAPIGLADRPQQDLAALGAHRPARHIERGPADGVGDLVKGQPVPS